MPFLQWISLPHSRAEQHSVAQELVAGASADLLGHKSGPAAQARRLETKQQMTRAVLGALDEVKVRPSLTTGTRPQYTCEAWVGMQAFKPDVMVVRQRAGWAPTC